MESLIFKIIIKIKKNKIQTIHFFISLPMFSWNFKVLRTLWNEALL